MRSYGTCLSLHLTSSRSNHATVNDKIFFLYGWVILIYMSKLLPIFNWINYIFIVAFIYHKVLICLARTFSITRVCYFYCMFLSEICDIQFCNLIFKFNILWLSFPRISNYTTSNGVEVVCGSLGWIFYNLKSSHFKYRI